jgi:uncharacterized protein (TIGR03437 family)
VVRNEDGTLNDAEHPALRGSTVTVYGTGLGLTKPPIEAGSVAATDGVQPAYSVFVWGGLSAPGAYTSPYNPSVPASTLAGFVSAVFQIKVPVPNVSQPSSGVQRLTVAIEPFSPGYGEGGHPPFNLPSPADLVGVYVK